MTSRRILIVESGDSFYRVLQASADFASFQLINISNIKMSIRSVYQEQPNLILLDMDLPENGAEKICEQIRLFTDLPIVMFGALMSEENEIHGFRIGGDDVVCRYANTEVIAARISALLRRFEWQVNPSGIDKRFPSGIDRYDDGYLDIDLEHHEVRCRGERIPLTGTEYKMLAYFFEHNGRCVSYSELARHVWGDKSTGSKAVVQVYVSMLRRKLEANPKQPVYLINEHGRGYRFAIKTVSLPT